MLLHQKKNTTFAVVKPTMCVYTIPRDGKTYIHKGVTDALVLTIRELRNFPNVCQEQSNGNASWDVLYTAFIGFVRFLSLVVRIGILYIYIYVGLSALLVSTDMAMRRPTNRGTSNRLAPRFFVYIPKPLLISLFRS